MKFVKGQTPWNKGLQMKTESKMKISKANSGKPNPNKGKGSSYNELLIRFESKIEVLLTNCWRWNGFIENNGYGSFSIGGASKISAHRMSYMLYNGPIDFGLTIDHLCRNRWCVNPKHLEAVTMKKNLLRSNAITTINKRKNQCNSGHLFSKENTYLRPDGSRDCRVCRCVAQKKYLQKKKGETNLE